MIDNQLLSELLLAPSPSGFEQPVSDVIARALSDAGCEISRDRLGSVFARHACGIADAPVLMLEAHTDEVGLIVTGIDDGGFLRFSKLGGPDARTMPDSEVLVLSDPVRKGVICCLPPHVLSKADMKTYAKPDDCGIDIGLSHDEAVAAVKPGTAVVFVSEPAALANGRITSKALDNRFCAAALCEVMRRIKSLKLDFDVVFCGASQEETGCRGARGAAFSAAPDAAVVMDVTFAKAPGVLGLNTFELGKELSVCVGPETDRKLNELLFKAGEDTGVACKPEVYGGGTGTDAGAIQISRSGVPTAVLSIPIRNMHTPCEVGALSDLEHAADLLTAFVGGLKGEMLRG